MEVMGKREFVPTNLVPTNERSLIEEDLYAKIWIVFISLPLCMLILSEIH